MSVNHDQSVTASRMASVISSMARSSCSLMPTNTAWWPSVLAAKVAVGWCQRTIAIAKAGSGKPMPRPLGSLNNGRHDQALEFALDG